MVVLPETLSLESTAVFGSTQLTLELLELLDDVAQPRFVLGLSAERLAHKANGVDLTEHCAARGVPHSVDDDWVDVAAQLERLDVETVIVFGDSRIVPESITSNYLVVGNHGARLPDVQGGASLVWGRMADLGHWGVSLFRLNERLDSGEILANSRFEYDPDEPMSAFVARADAATVEAFRALYAKGIAATENRPYLKRVDKSVDSYVGVTTMKHAIDAGEPVYMPIRTPADGHLNPAWPLDFQQVFKVANDCPYPHWTS